MSTYTFPSEPESTNTGDVLGVILRLLNGPMDPAQRDEVQRLAWYLTERDTDLNRVERDSLLDYLGKRKSRLLVAVEAGLI